MLSKEVYECRIGGVAVYLFYRQESFIHHTGGSAQYYGHAIFIHFHLVIHLVTAIVPVFVITLVVIVAFIVQWDFVIIVVLWLLLQW